MPTKMFLSQSEPFKNAITGGWSETTECKLSLHEWDGETVGRLVEFLYTGPIRSGPVNEREELLQDR